MAGSNSFQDAHERAKTLSVFSGNTDGIVLVMSDQSSQTVVRFQVRPEDVGPLRDALLERLKVAK
jgi:hypothetical protein